jgi:hypothetical protein
MKRSLAVILCIFTLWALGATPATAASLGFNSPPNDRRCLQLIGLGLEKLRLINQGMVNLPGCGVLEIRLFRFTTYDTAVSSVRSTGRQTACTRTEFRNLYGVTTWWIKTCDTFWYDGDRITYFYNPPDVTWWTSLGWEVTNSTKGAEWVAEPWSARAWSDTTVRLSAFGWTVGTKTVNHRIHMYGNGHFH